MGVSGYKFSKHFPEYYVMPRLIKIKKNRAGAPGQLSQSVECAILDLGVMISSPMLRVEMTF